MAISHFTVRAPETQHHSDPERPAAAVGAAISRQDEALLQAWEQYRADEQALQAIETPHCRSEEVKRFISRQHDIVDVIMDTPAVTPAGIIGKLKVALIEVDDDGWFNAHLVRGEPVPAREVETRGCNLLWSTIQDLERLAEVSSAPTPPHAAPDPHAGWHDERMALLGRGVILDEAANIELLRRIASTPAHTAEGVIVLMSALLDVLPPADIEKRDLQSALIINLCCSVERLAARAGRPG